MATVYAARTTILVLLAAGVSLFLGAASRAETLTFSNMPASNAAAEISRRLGVSIVFRGAGANGSQPVTFSVQDADTPDGRLQAVSELANALGMDFQKVYVVSKIDAGTIVPEIKIDTNGPIVFASTKISAREAIQTIAAVDGAMAQISGAVEGNVVFPSLRMTAPKAAAAVAKQTQTVWRAYYGLYKRGQGPARLNGEILDRTSSGQAITELPLLTFRNTISTPAPIWGGLESTTSVPNGFSVTTVPNANTAAYPGYGFDPYGYSGYGYNPYGDANPYAYNSYGPYAYGGLGYPAPNGGVAYPGAVYTPGMGAEQAMPGINAPGIVAPGVGTTTVPNANSAILPDYPYAGNLGGQVVVGGY